MEATLITQSIGGVSNEDKALILDVVKHYGYKTPLEELARILRHIFLHNIKPGHYMALGALVGEISATVHAERKFLNSLKPCQRQN